MALRAQVSLIFRDAEMYKNLIEPLKHDKELNNTIIKCLSAYYYDEEVRNKIECINEEETVKHEANQGKQDAINSIYATLAAQDYIAQSGLSSMGVDVENISNPLDGVNDVVRGTDGVSETESGMFTAQPALGVHKEQKQPDKMDLLFSAVAHILDKLDDSEGKEILMGKQPKIVNPILEEDLSDFQEALIAEEIKEEPIKEEPIEVQKVELHEEPIEIQEEVSNADDATSDMESLLGSLGF